MSIADYSSAGRMLPAGGPPPGPTNGGHPSSAMQGFRGGPYPGVPGTSQGSRSATPGGGAQQQGFRGMPNDHFMSGPQPTLAAPRALPPYPRFTSPQPTEGSARSPSPTKRGGGPSGFSGYGDARERWASIGQLQGQHQPGPPSFDGPSPRPHSNHPPYINGPASAGPQENFFGFNDVFAPPPPPPGQGRGSVGPERAYPPPPLPPQTDDSRFDQQGMGMGFGAHGHAREDGFASALPHSGPPFGDQPTAGMTSSGSLSPHSLMQFQHHQMQAQQQQQQQMAMQAGAGNAGISGTAQNLGSGLMSNSGQPAEEITTVFIVGFPDDMTEREFANMFLFARGFEASTLKIPPGGMPSQNGPSAGQREPGSSQSLAGPGGPYNPVGLPSGGNMFDMGPMGGWDDHSLNMALARNGGNDPFSLANMHSALGSASGSGSGALGAGVSGKIKQIIGFAKFRTRAEALEARDALNGKKIDADKGCVLKTEMAKKNLHTKQRPVLPGPNSGPETPFQGGPSQPSGANSGFLPGPTGAMPSDRDSSRPAPPGPFPSSFPPSGGQSFETFARAGGPPSASLSGMISPQGQGDVFGSDFLRGPGPARASGAAAIERSGDSIFGGLAVERTAKSPSDGPIASSTSKWASMGPLDYFGPVTEPERRESQAPQPQGQLPQPTPPASSALNQPVHPRGPDWSAIGSPPGLFSPTRSFGGDPVDTAGQRTSVFGRLKASAAGQEELAQEESTASKRRDTTSSMGGSSNLSASPPKPAKTAAPSAGSQTQVKRQQQPAEGEPTQSQLARSPRSGSAAPSAFAARFGSLRLDPVNTTAASTSGTDEQPPTSATAGKTSAGGNTGTASGSSAAAAKSADLPSPTLRSFSIDQNPPGNTLFVGNLPGNISPAASATLEDQLRQRFAPCAGYRQLSYRIKNNGPMCFVEFDDVQHAARALAEVNGDTMNGAVKNGGLRLSFSKNPLFRNTSSGAATVGSSSAQPASPVLAAQPPSFSSLGKVSESLRVSDDTGRNAAGSNVDPLDLANTLEETSYKDGFSAGQAHGKLHGTFEGRQLGREKGFEIWDEVGFYEGTARFWKGVLAKQMDSLPTHLRSRKQAKQLQHLDILETLIAAFPTKNRSSAAGDAPALPQMPPASSSPPKTTNPDDTTPATADGAGPADEDEQSEDPEALAQMDMATLLERIRARYKVVCASLGIPAKQLEAGGDGKGKAGLDAGSAAAAAANGGDAASAAESTAAPVSANTNAAPPRGAAVIGGKVVNTSQLRF